MAAAQTMVVATGSVGSNSIGINSVGSNSVGSNSVGWENIYGVIKDGRTWLDRLLDRNRLRLSDRRISLVTISPILCDPFLQPVAALAVGSHLCRSRRRHFRAAISPGLCSPFDSP
jgi:hypothetical protein